MQRIWIFFTGGFLITLFCGLVYVAVQQNYRQSAYDPQIQMSEDTASTLDRGQTPPPTNPVGQIDLAKSLAPFLIMYDLHGKAVYSTGELHGQIPVPPSGVFDYTKENGQDRFTWEPESGVREATIVTHYTNGFVLAGRSMREVEKRILGLVGEVGFVWLFSIVVLLLAVLTYPRKKK